MKRILVSLFALMLITSLSAKDYSVSSPSGRLQMSISAGKGATTWALAVNGETVMDSNRMSLTIDGNEIGPDARVIKVTKGRLNEHIDAPLYRQASFDANCNRMIVKMKGGWSIEVRAYDDGVAYRFVTDLKGQKRINGETAEFSFTGPVNMLVPYSPTRERDRYRNSFESPYESATSGDMEVARGRLAFMPIYIDLGDNGRLLLMESDIWNYPGMFLKTTNKGFEAEFPPYPENTSVANGKYLDYLCDTDASRTYPWRIIAYGVTDCDLPVNNMVYQLSSPSRIEDVSWIKPGFSTWDWWSNFKLHGVDFKSGINTDAYLYHIDFAAVHGVKYVLIDEGWYRNGDILHPIPEMDIPRLCSYAAEKGVGLLLWINTNALGLNPDQVFEQYASMGVAGFKIDFFDNQEAAMVDRIAMYAQKAAKLHLVLDYHGIYKPVGLSRTWPNVLNYEGVVGLENAKGYTADQLDLPRNDVMIPYIRMAAGQMDYTPGALRNANRNDFRKINERPMSQGTRGHQVACYVVYDEPLAMLCDSPSDYLQEEETVRFITSMPTVFDSTKILSGKVGEWIVTMREKAGIYYIGGMTSWQDRDVEVDFSFLPTGKWTCTVFRDGINADKVASDYVIEDRIVDSSSRLKVHMAPGGGFAMIIRSGTEIAPYIPADELPDIVACIPAPPADPSPEFDRDKVRYTWGKQQREDPARLQMAIRDAIWNLDTTLAIMSGPFGMTISAEATPRIYEVVTRGVRTIEDIRYRPKAYYFRTRPFAYFKEPSIFPQDDEWLATEGSYPSGHTIRAWACALILAEINPDAAAAVFARAWASGESRVISGCHWQSDVDASRPVASIGYARLQTSGEFRTQMEKAKKEYRELSDRKCAISAK